MAHPARWKSGLKTFLLPTLIAWTVGMRLKAVLRPEDAPWATSDGPNPVHVLVFGSGPAVGRGVLSHSLALPGQLSWQLARATRRGVRLALTADPSFTAKTAAASLTELPLHTYDAIVLTWGAHDAMALTGAGEWRTSLAEMVGALIRGSQPMAEIIVTGIPSLSSLPAFDSALGAIAARHAVVLNDVSQELCAGICRVTFVSLEDRQASGDWRHRSPATYRMWAQSITAHLALATPGAQQLPPQSAYIVGK
ncbi:MAG: diguanylate cyclase [Homoserinimonas sp.]|nr:diguanylate cyclase [Homoserinimonas sp.]